MAHLFDGQPFPVFAVVVKGAECARVHAVDVESSVEVVYFVLQDAGVPAGSADGTRLAQVVEAIDADAGRARDERGESGKAEAALEEVGVRFRIEREDGIDQDVKRNRLALAFHEKFGANVLNVFGLVFDDGELEAETDLRRGEADPWGLVHRLTHIFDEPPDFAGEDFFAA